MIGLRDMPGTLVGGRGRGGVSNRDESPADKFFNLRQHPLGTTLGFLPLRR